MGALSLAAKGAANFFAAGLGDMLPQLQILFESDNFSSWSNEQVQDVIESIADGVTDSVSTSVADKAEWSVEPAEYAPCREAFAKWIEEQDSEILADNGGERFFGLQHYENTAQGVGDGKGTPLWLCKKCHPRWEEAKKDEAAAAAAIKAEQDKIATYKAEQEKAVAAAAAKVRSRLDTTGDATAATKIQAMTGSVAVGPTDRTTASNARTTSLTRLTTIQAASGSNKTIGASAVSPVPLKAPQSSQKQKKKSSFCLLQ
jgi:hypothetical protein